MSCSKDGEKVKDAINKSKRIIIVVACIVVIFFIALFVCMQCKDCDGFVDIDCMDMLCDDCCAARHLEGTSSKCNGDHCIGVHTGVDAVVSHMFDSSVEADPEEVASRIEAK